MFRTTNNLQYNNSPIDEERPLLGRNNGLQPNICHNFPESTNAVQSRHHKLIFRQSRSLSSAPRYSSGRRKRSKRDSLSQTLSIPMATASVNEDAWLKKLKAFVDRQAQKPSLRQQLAYKCDTTRAGRIWEIIDASITLLFVMLYVWNTGYVGTKPGEKMLPQFLLILDVVLAATILILFIPRVWLAPDRIIYLLGCYSLSTFASVLPVMVNYIIIHFDSETRESYMAAEPTVILYPIRFLRLHLAISICVAPVKSSVIKVSVIARKCLKVESNFCSAIEISRLLLTYPIDWRTGSTILVTLLMATALVHFVTWTQHTSDAAARNLSFYDAFFFTVVASTVGTGASIVPDSTFTRFVILYVMVAGAIFIPTHFAELLRLIAQKSKYEHSFKGERNQDHVIVAGTFDAINLFEFLREFFCEDHGLAKMQTRVIIMNPNEPSEEIAMLLEDPVFVNRVQYVKGSATTIRSLEKVRANCASGVFLLSSKFTVSDDAEDAEQMMRALSMKKYNPELKLYVQMHLPENVPHFDFLAKDVVCIDEFNLGLMAQSLIVPGLASMVALLTTSITETTSRTLRRKAEKKPDLEWAIEYIEGATQEIYAVTFPESLHGLTFLECSEIIYLYLGTVLFSIGVHKRHDAEGWTIGRSPLQIYLNPQDYIIAGGEIGFVVSSNSEITDRIMDFGKRFCRKDQFSNYGSNCITVDRLPKDLSCKDKNMARTTSKVTQDNSSDPASLSKPLNKRLKIITSQSATNVNGDAERVPPSPLPVNPPTRAEISQLNIRKAAESLNRSNFSELDVENHILICDCSPKFPGNLEIFINIIRQKKENIPVVILSLVEPALNERKLLETFGCIHFVKGSPMKRTDLYRANVHSAQRCLVLSDSQRYHPSIRGTADASTLLAMVNIESMMRDDCFVVVECVDRNTFKMVGNGDTVRIGEEYVQALMCPSFVSGRVYTPYYLDTILCQWHILDILKQLIFSNEFERKDSNVTATNRHTSRIAPSKLAFLRIPARYQDCLYEIFYGQLVREHKTIPLGLYRYVQQREGPFWYVFINPSKSTILHEHDRVYVIVGKESKFDDWELFEDDGMADMSQKG